MARLSDAEKRQLVAATKRRSAKSPPLHRPMTPRAYVEFATFAARFSGATKPVRFVGDEWKL
jgi:hypothetical protein